MWPFKKSKPKEPSSYYALVVCIGSGSVSAVLASFAPNTKPVIVASEVSQLPIDEEPDGNLYIERMHQSLRDTLSNVADKSTVVPARIYVSLGNPWCTGQIRTMHHSKKSPFTVTAKLGDELIETDRIRFIEKVLEITEEESLIPLDSTILETKINGYVAKNPIGQRGRELDMTVYMSVMPKKVQSEIKHQVDRYYRAPISFFSEQLASYSASRNLTDANSYQLLKIGEEQSELLIIEDNVLRGGVSFPLGKYFLLRTLMNELKQSPMEAISLLQLCRDGHANKNVALGVNQILEKVETEWKLGLANAVEKLSDTFTLPSKILVSITLDISPWFVKMIENEQYERTTKLTEKPTVALLTNSHYSRYIDFGDIEKITPDLALSTIYISSLGV